jgi:hypothetical protein
VVVRQVERRRAALVVGAAEPVLDLRDPGGDAELRAAMAGRPTHPGGYATVVSATDLIRYPDLLAAVAGLARCLAPDGEIRFVEPVQQPGALGTILGTVWSARPAVAGLHLQRDLAATLRAAGFTVTDIERFTVPTSVWPLRHFAVGAARRFPTASTGEELPDAR